MANSMSVLTLGGFLMMKIKHFSTTAKRDVNTAATSKGSNEREKKENSAS